MATAAEFIRWLFQERLMVTAVGFMAGEAAVLHRFVNVSLSVLSFIMALKTERLNIFGQQEAVVSSVGIMAGAALATLGWLMNNFSVEV